MEELGKSGILGFDVVLKQRRLCIPFCMWLSIDLMKSLCSFWGFDIMFVEALFMLASVFMRGRTTLGGCQAPKKPKGESTNTKGKSATTEGESHIPSKARIETCV